MLKKITPIAKYVPTKYVDFSEPDINALNLNKNETALQEVTDKVNETITGIEDLDAPTFEDYTGATQVPTPETALAAINSKSKLSLLFSNIKAFLKGAVTIGMIVNNCATDNPNLPVSAAQAKALMDAVTKLNSELDFTYMSGSGLYGSLYTVTRSGGVKHLRWQITLGTSAPLVSGQTYNIVQLTAPYYAKDGMSKRILVTNDNKPATVVISQSGLVTLVPGDNMTGIIYFDESYI